MNKIKKEVVAGYVPSPLVREVEKILDVLGRKWTLSRAVAEGLQLFVTKNRRRLARVDR